MDRGQTALALVAAMKHDDYEGASVILNPLDWSELVMVVTHLAGVVVDSWSHDCDRLGVDWDEFMQEAGLFLARAEEGT